MGSLRAIIAARGTRVQRLLGLFGLVAALAVAVPAGAQGAYWFFTGYLPLADGTGSVHKAHDCCATWQDNRISWTTGSHVMNHLGIQYNGSWYSQATPSNVYDHTVRFNTDYTGGSGFNRAGCQIPAAWAWYAVWTNCRFGIGS
jgi:hypothetical protein